MTPASGATAASGFGSNRGSGTIAPSRAPAGCDFAVLGFAGPGFAGLGFAGLGFAGLGFAGPGFTGPGTAGLETAAAGTTVSRIVPGLTTIVAMHTHTQRSPDWFHT